VKGCRLRLLLTPPSRLLPILFAWQRYVKKQLKLALAALKATASFTAGGAESSSAPREAGQPTLMADLGVAVKPAPVGSPPPQTTARLHYMRILM
jgi:hypothetical protein